MDARATDFSQRVIIIRSDRCTVANECRASFVLPVPIVIPTGSVAMLQFIKLTFPLSMYLINQFNDSLTIAGTTHSLTHGVYNPATLLLHLRELTDVTVDYNPTTYRFTFSSENAFTIGSNTTCLRVLGFTNEQCDASATSHTGAHVADLHPLNSIKVITNFAIHSLDSSMGDDAHLLARVPVVGNTHETSSWRWETYVPSHKYRVLVRNAVISEMVVELKDEDNNHVDFNGIPWCIKLAISHVQTKNIKPLLNSFLNASQARTPDADTIDETGPPARERAPQRARSPKTKRPRRRKQQTARRRKNS
jgi:hypothetical protein